MAALKSELLRIIERKLLQPIFQPIACLSDKQVFGYEAFIRGPSDSPLHSPLTLFDTAERYGYQSALELNCHEAIINQYVQLQLPGKLFVKVDPVLRLERDNKKDKLYKYLKKNGISPDKIIIELSEHHVTDGDHCMQDAAAYYHDLGFNIAIDHLTTQYSDLRFLSQLEPEYLKIDKHYVQALHEDEVKLNFLQSIQSLAVAINAIVIPVGVESIDEFKAILRIGITHAQGFYFSRPITHPVVELDEKKFTIGSHSDKNLSLRSRKISGITQFVSPIASFKTVDEVLDLLQHNPRLEIVPVTEEKKAIGLVVRDKFFSKLFASRYGIELNGKKTIKSFINYIPLNFDKEMTIEYVSKQLTTSMRGDQAFIITDNEEYYGIATLLDLLEDITQQQIDNARHANPLTFLPGSVYINDVIDSLLMERKTFCVGYFDLDHFKPYNDVYGYSAGDDIIKAVAETLAECITSEVGYVGHIGGDDFIVILLNEAWLGVCENILQVFASKVPGFYSAADVEKGGIECEDRSGRLQFFPLLSLSVGLVDHHATGECQSHVDIADLASEAKKQAKKIIGNSYFINRRSIQNKGYPLK